MDTRSSPMDVEEEAQGGPVAVSMLIDDLRNEEVQSRLQSVNNLPIIGKTLGPERTRDELIPYLNEFIDDEDEVLLALADKFGELVSCVGGGSYSHVLLVPLETLCGVEESSVRDKAVSSIVRICGSMPAESVTKFAVPLVQRLATGEWFTSRMSATGLFSTVYAVCAESVKQSLRVLFTNLCRDDTPMVRRAVCAQIGPFAQVLEYPAVVADVVPAFKLLAGDDQDSVRLLVVDNCIALGRILNSGDFESHVLPTVQALCRDPAWRVRYMVADKFPEVLTVSRQHSSSDSFLVEAYVNLFSDLEPEVRTSASSRIAQVAEIVGSGPVLSHIIPHCKERVTDVSNFNRAALAKELMGICAVLNREQITQHVLPLFLQMLRDPEAEVRLNVISRLDTVNKAIGAEELSQALLPAIEQLATDPKWRVRLAIIEHVPLLAQQLGPKFFEDKLDKLCFDWLCDPVFSIREAATTNLTKITQSFGVEWACNHFVRDISMLTKDTSYLNRITALHCVIDLAPTVGPEATSQALLPIVVGMAGDPVPNVRFNVAKTLKVIRPQLTAGVVESAVLPCLRALSQDQDQDVQYFAQDSMTVFVRQQ